MKDTIDEIYRKCFEHAPTSHRDSDGDTFLWAAGLKENSPLAAKFKKLEQTNFLDSFERRQYFRTPGRYSEEMLDRWSPPRLF